MKQKPRITIFSVFLIIAIFTIYPSFSYANAQKESIFTIDSTSYLLNGIVQNMEVPPYIEDGRTFIPIRYVGYALGISDPNILWDNDSQTVTLIKGDKVVHVQIGSNTIRVNNVSSLIDAAPQNRDGRTCLPIASIANAFGAQVNWDAKKQTVIITSPSTEFKPESSATVSALNSSGGVDEFNLPPIGSVPAKSKENVTLILANTSDSQLFIKRSNGDFYLLGLQSEIKNLNSLKNKSILIEPLNGFWNKIIAPESGQEAKIFTNALVFPSETPKNLEYITLSEFPFRLVHIVSYWGNSMPCVIYKKSNCIFISIDDIAKLFGATVLSGPGEKMYTISRDNIIVFLQVSNTKILSGFHPSLFIKTWDYAPVEFNGKVYVSLGDIGECLGATYKWHEVYGTLSINYGNSLENDSNL